VTKKKEKQKLLRITLVKSPIGYEKKGDTVRAMGLRKMHATVELQDNPTVRGQINKVRHLLMVEEV
jgi:large subunit ribosomal protein L30